MNEEKNVIIDYLSVTFPLELIENEDEQERSEAVYRLFRNFFHLIDQECRQDSYGKNNFKYQYVLADFIILRCAGPVNESGFKICQLELKGEGCREFERRRPDITWVDFLNFLYGLDSSYKRIDVTIDDFSGIEINQDYIKSKLDKKHYTSTFRGKPKFYGTQDEGFTIELGTRKSPIQLVIYDKLKQQQAKNKPCEHDYWTRYEMRFRHAKADAVVLTLLKEYQDSNNELYRLDLAKFAKSELYAILDLKEDNNYSIDKQHRAETDKRWLSFLDESEKAVLPKIAERVSTSETRRSYIMPKAVSILMMWIEMCGRDYDLFFYILLREIYVLSGNMNKNQRKKFNEFLLEQNIPPLDNTGFEQFRNTMHDKYIEMEMPF
ncbi:MAG: replication initiation factor domain-containing protein [Acholeplasmatales bacterium]|nr:replication initiation factor domain-containing protein [Acholeplasmatales bacterium]